VGVSASDTGEAVRTGSRVREEVSRSFPDRPAMVLLLCDGETPAIPVEPPSGNGVSLMPWSHPGQSAVEALLRAGEVFDASACALVIADGDDGPTTKRRLLAPVLEDSFDLVCPCYATHRFEAVLTTAIVYPLTRALFGKRLRQPVGEELAVSHRFVKHLLGEAWHADPAHALDRIWLVTEGLSRGFRVCQAHLGPRRRQSPGAEADLSTSLAQVVGLLFHVMRLHAPAWHRMKNTETPKTYGEPETSAGDIGQPQVAPMLSAFRLGFKELGQIWGEVLSPQTLFALKRLALAPEESFRLEDALWARIVYEFAVGYHLALMDRTLLLRSMTPLYLGWVAGFVREVRDLEPDAVEARAERLCRAFEVGKPYLISRWRWPDRFNP